MIEITAPSTAQRKHALDPRPLVSKEHPVPCRGKLAMMLQSSSSWHRRALHCPNPMKQFVRLTLKQSYSSRRSRHQSERRHQRVDTRQPFPMPWPPQWQMPAQWLFWTPWVFHHAQGSCSGRLPLGADTTHTNQVTSCHMALDAATRMTMILALNLRSWHCMILCGQKVKSNPLS